jgi:hypothetical protein
MTDKSETKPEVSPERLVKVYIKMRNKRAELSAAFDEQDNKVKTQMEKVKQALLDYCKDHNVESVRTTEGLFYRTVKTNYWTSDWESMRNFIVEHKVPELLHERIHQGNIKQFLDEHPELLPPGLNVDSEYGITVRRK